MSAHANSRSVPQLGTPSDGPPALTVVTERGYGPFMSTCRSPGCATLVSILPEWETARISARAQGTQVTFGADERFLVASAARC